MRRLVSTIGCLVVISFANGCSQSLEAKLGLEYQPPDIPTNLELYYTPAEDHYAFQLLRDGETKIDMHEYYREYHRMGWDEAIKSKSKNQEFTYKSKGDVYEGVVAMRSGLESFWLGYKLAVDQITAAERPSDK